MWMSHLLTNMATLLETLKKLKRKHFFFLKMKEGLGKQTIAVGLERG